MMQHFGGFGQGCDLGIMSGRISLLGRSLMPQYPLRIRFKSWFNNNCSVQDCHNQVILRTVRHSTLKTAITVLNCGTGLAQYEIEADRLIAWHPKYQFRNPQGQPIGRAIKKGGFKSWWQVHYEICVRDQVMFQIIEQKPWMKLFEWGTIGLPFLGLFVSIKLSSSGISAMAMIGSYLALASILMMPLLSFLSFWQRIYNVYRNDGSKVIHMTGRLSYRNSQFKIQLLSPLTPTEESQVLLGLLVLATEATASQSD
jgi:hypothetical protein